MRFHRFLTFWLLVIVLILTIAVYKMQGENKTFRNQIKTLTAKVDRIKDESDKVISTAYYVIGEAKTITDMTNYVPCKSIFIFPEKGGD